MGAVCGVAATTATTRPAAAAPACDDSGYDAFLIETGKLTPVTGEFLAG